MDMTVVLIIVTSLIAITAATAGRMIYIARKFRYPEREFRDAMRRLRAGRFM